MTGATGAALVFSLIAIAIAAAAVLMVAVRRQEEQPESSAVVTPRPITPPAWRGVQAVENKRFTPTWLREGYDMGEVDQFLDEMQVELARLYAIEDALVAGLKGATS